MSQPPESRLDDEKVLLYMMGLAFIEIRHPEEPRLQSVLADIYHNVPSGLAHGSCPTELLKRAKACAKRHGLKGYIDKIEAHVRNKHDL